MIQFFFFQTSAFEMWQLKVSELSKWRERFGEWWRIMQIPRRFQEWRSNHWRIARANVFQSLIERRRSHRRRPRFSHFPCENEVAFPSLVPNRRLWKYSCLGPLQVGTKFSVHSGPLISHRDQEVGQSILLVLTSSNKFKIINSWREDFPRSYASKNRLFLARKPKRPMRPVENIYGACRWN